MRNQALKLLFKPIRQLVIAYVVGVALSPIAIIIALTVIRGVPLVLLMLAAVWSGGSIPWQGMGEGVLAWTVIIFVLITASFSWVLFRNLQRWFKLAPVVKQGTERHGSVTHVSYSSRGARGIQYNSVKVRIDLHVGFAEGEREEPVGTELPKFAVGTPTSVWTHGNTSVAFCEGGFIECRWV